MLSRILSDVTAQESKKNNDPVDGSGVVKKQLQARQPFEDITNRVNSSGVNSIGGSVSEAKSVSLGGVDCRGPKTEAAHVSDDLIVNMNVELDSQPQESVAVDQGVIDEFLGSPAKRFRAGDTHSLAGDSIVSLQDREETVVQQMQESVEVVDVIEPYADDGCLAAFHRIYTDIYDSLAAAESCGSPTTEYFSRQQCNRVTPAIRATIVDWLGDAAVEINLRPATLLIGVVILDRFLSVVTVSVQRLQLVALCCLWLAAKFDEVRPPGVEAMLPLAAHQFPREDLIHVEPIILSTVGSAFTYPTALDFLHCFQQSTAVPISGLGVTISEFIVELCVQHPLYLRHRPSAIAAASIFIARYILFSQEHQTANLHKLQRLRDSYLQYYKNIGEVPSTAFHPQFKSYIDFEPLCEQKIESIIEASWTLELIFTTRYKLSTLLPCLLDVIAILIQGMGYHQHESNAYKQYSLDLVESTELPEILQFKPIEENTYVTPREPNHLHHCALRETDIAALPSPGAVLLTYYSGIINSTTKPGVEPIDTHDPNSFANISPSVRRIIVSHSLSVDMTVPMPFNAFFGPGYLPTKHTYVRYASDKMSHIAERFLPPLDLHPSILKSVAGQLESLFQER